MGLRASKVHCSVISLQLRRVDFEGDYKSVKLTTAIQDELNEAEVFVQEAQIIRLETDVEASVTEYEADRVRTKAKSQADLIVSRANIAAAATIEAARSAALSSIYDTLGVDNEAQRSSLDYILTLTTKTGMDVFVDFDGGSAWHRAGSSAETTTTTS